MFWLRTILLCLLVIPLQHAIANADEVSDDDVRISEIDADIDNTTIIWLKKGTTRNEIRTIASKFAGEPEYLHGVYESLGGFVVRMSPALAEARRQEIEQQANKKEPLASVTASRMITDHLDYIEPNGYAKLFDADCDNDETFAYPTSQLPIDQSYWLTQVKAPLLPKTGNTFASRVWIIDTGIASAYAGSELNIDTALSAECKKAWSECRTSTNGGDWNDKLGHGTMIAGIIGAIDNSNGFLGVAPNVKLVAVKAFNRGYKARWDVLYKAVDYVADNANSYDVVNISWGARWDPEPWESPNPSNPRRIEQALQDLATGSKKLRISLSAGNNDQLNASGYVQAVTPARAGGISEGTILTASANNSLFAFWDDSAFGNGACPDHSKPCNGPPSFAEPGVDIKSLWIKQQGNKCTGTSFAAAILSGLLVQRAPIVPSRMVTGDPSEGSKPYQADWVGVCEVGGGGTCVEK